MASENGIKLAGKVVRRGFTRWVRKYHFRIIVFNLLIVAMFLLHSVGYFHPFLPITINLIITVAFILAIFLLGARSRAFFAIALIFWLFTAFFKLVRVDIWAERSAIYVFEALVVGVVVLFFEEMKK